MNVSRGGIASASGANLDTNGTYAARDAGFTQVTPGELALEALTDNAGATETQALLAGSVALDAVTDCTLADGTTPLTADQRGEPRPADGDGHGDARCDIGAYERLQPQSIAAIEALGPWGGVVFALLLAAAGFILPLRCKA